MLIIVALLVTAVIASLSGKDNSAPTIADYLDGSGLPPYNEQLLELIESCFDACYYTDIEEPETLAAKTVSAYNEFCKSEIDEGDKDAVTLAIIDCYIYAIGDKYAFYRTEAESNDYTTDMSGSFVGIGITVSRNEIENTITVTSVEPNSPAQRSGMMVDDLIVAVDGSSIDDIGINEIVNKIRGEVGTAVTVTVLRGGERIQCEAIREKITETTVFTSYLVDGKVGYIRITGFKSNTAAQFISAVREVEASGASSVIFDLRGNPGGYLSAVTAMLSYLVPDGTTIASFSNSKQPIYASSGTELEETDHVLTIPSAVLCNSSSASAAELFCAAMRDYNEMSLLQATLVGTLTYKKGVMQTTIPFSDKSTLTLTTALYNPPSGTNFNEVGVTPDVTVGEGEDYIEKALDVLSPYTE